MRRDQTAEPVLVVVVVHLAYMRSAFQVEVRNNHLVEVAARHNLRNHLAGRVVDSGSHMVLLAEEGHCSSEVVHMMVVVDSHNSAVADSLDCTVAGMVLEGCRIVGSRRAAVDRSHWSQGSRRTLQVEEEDIDQVWV